MRETYPTGKVPSAKSWVPRQEMRTEDEREDAEETPLKRAITGRLLFLFVLGDVLGAGIYALVGEVAGEVGGAIWAPMAVALGLALLTAGSYAELVTKYPKAGGSAVYAERAYGSPLVSFLVGYCMLAAGVVSAAGLAHAFAGEYLQTFVSISEQLAAVIFLLAIGALNARGIRESMRANVVMTCIEVTGLVLVVVAAGYFLADGGGDVGRAFELDGEKDAIPAIFAGAILAFYSFVGFETTANVAEEIENPSKVYPKALLGAILTAGVIYMIVGVAAATTVPVSELAGSTGPLLTVVDVSGIGIPDKVFSAIALVAVANGALLTMIMSSRMAYGMARQGLMPSPLARVLEGRRTPWVAIATTTTVAIGLSFLGNLETLAETVVLLLLFVFLSTNVAVLVLRRDRVEHDHFAVPSFLPVLGAASCVVLLTQQSHEVWLRGLALVALGVLIHFAMRTAGRTGDAARSGD